MIWLCRSSSAAQGTPAPQRSSGSSPSSPSSCELGPAPSPLLALVPGTADGSSPQPAPDSAHPLLLLLLLRLLLLLLLVLLLLLLQLVLVMLVLLRAAAAAATGRPVVRRRRSIRTWTRRGSWLIGGTVPAKSP
jgi:hypothetical protein